MSNATPEMQPLAVWNPTRGIWEKPQLDLFGQQEQFWETWPTSGMTLNGKLYRRAEPVLPTDDNEFSLLPTPVSSDAHRGPHWNKRTGATLAYAVIHAKPWDIYQPAIQHWERVTSRSAPPAVETNRNGNLRITVAFVAWMMGWPEYWLDELSRPNQLRLLGNGVVPQQAALAIEGLGIIVA